MDPNHWNYNLQYGHSTPGLNLSHSLQHGSLAGRASLPAVNYPGLATGLDVPIIGTMPPLASQSSHKSMALQQGQLVFDPTTRATEQQTTLPRYDTPSSKSSFPRDAGNQQSQLLETASAAARLWGLPGGLPGSSQFSATSLYNLFGSHMQQGPAVTSVSSSPTSVSPGISKSQGQLHEPPPAHSSNTNSRLSSMQRTPHASDLFPYSRSSESIMPSSLSQMSSLYSNSKQQQQQTPPPPSPSLHRQTPAHQTPHSGFSQIEDLSSNPQSQIYASYTNMPETTQAFSPDQLTAEINYDPVSPAPNPISENANILNIAQFPADLAGLADKFQENDYRLKMDSQRGINQTLQHDMSVTQQQKIAKDMAANNPNRLNVWSQIASQNQVQQALPLVSQHSSFTSSMQQHQQPANTIQAMAADSTTKPKRVRNRKNKKPESVPPQQNQNIKKSISPVTSNASQNRQSQQSSHILNMPSTPISNNTYQQNQQTFRTVGGTNQYNPREPQRSVTPSAPQNFSVQDNQSAYSVSPKIEPGRNEKSRQTSSSDIQNNHLYRSNIPDQQQHNQQQNIQNYRASSPVDNRAGGRGYTDQGEGFSASRTASAEPGSISHPYDALENPGEAGHFHLADFASQPFLEQLVAPMTVPASTFGHTSMESGEVVYATLVTPAESARLQQQQAAQMSAEMGPTYHGETVHEIRPIGHIGGSMAMEDVSFGSFFNQGQAAQALLQQQQQQQQQQLAQQQQQQQDESSLTFVPDVTQDDELANFSQPSTSEAPKVVEPTPQTKQLRDSFQNSFLSYLGGAKQETLSSVSTSTVTKKPQLPKYIPEPRRPRPPPPPPKESITFSTLGKLEAGQSQVRNKVQNLISNLGDGKKEDKKDGFTVQRTGGLSMKISIPKSAKKNKFGIISDNSLLTQNMKAQAANKGKKRKGKYQGDSDGEMGPSTDLGFDLDDSPPPPARTSIGRKAKSESTKKKKKYAESDDSDGEMTPIVPLTLGKGKNKAFKGDDSDYDSDRDPVWMPFDVDLKQQGFEHEERKKKSKKHKHRSQTMKAYQHLQHPVKSSGHLVPSGSSTVGSSGGRTTTGAAFSIGEYIIEKKDLLNHESFPIWRLEKDGMMRKFEFRSQDGSKRHYPGGTFSTWTKSLENQFEVLKVREIPGKSKSEPFAVEVLEECRPKPPNDLPKLEKQYEDDPLVETFNIYLQVFLSQALEPSFLKAIIETNESFYVDALHHIDNLIEAKCKSIAKTARWQNKFQDCLHRCPLMKEIDRPNLKQACQACENGSPPTIKSVLLSGQSYDRFLLTHIGGGADIAQEFMIGKVASYYVRPYHTLFHYKYWLKQRCDSKVKSMKEGSGRDIPSENILDKCLENRSWVLQLFDNLNKLLRFEEGSR